MAVFCIERTKNYTVMSNYHLRDKALSLKSKGLLSMMLSLPEDWNYTTRGLAKICKEGVDAIGALRELEAAGYIVRHQLRDRQGRITYALMSRCGLEPEQYFGHEDFMQIFDFNTPAAIGALGTAVSQVNQQVLRQIGVIIQNYEREQLAERSVTHERRQKYGPL